MAAIYAGSSNYIPKNTTKTIHSKAGKLRSFIITGDGNATVTFYDNTSATGTILLVMDYTYYPLIFEFDKLMPLVFTTGLTIVTSANGRCFVITEA